MSVWLAVALGAAALIVALHTHHQAVVDQRERDRDEHSRRQRLIRELHRHD